MPNIPTLAALADDLENGRTSARKLVDDCLERIADTTGEGARAFIHVDAEAAIEAAEAMDRLREIKAAPSPFAGIPVSIKDLFDIRGQVTRAGSRALEDSAAGGSRCASGGAAASRRLCGDRPHQHDRIRLFRDRHQSALRHAEEHVAAQCRPCARRIVVGGGGVRRRPAWRMARSAPTPADRAGFRPPITASSASSRRSGACRSTAACRCRSRSTVSGPWRAPLSAARCSMPCWPTSQSFPCSRVRSRECGWRCRPRSRSTNSTMRWRRPSNARWKHCRARAR